MFCLYFAYEPPVMRALRRLAMHLRTSLAVVTCFVYLAPCLADEPPVKSAPGVEIRLAEDEASDELIEAEIVGTDDKHDGSTRSSRITNVWRMRCTARPGGSL